MASMYKARSKLTVLCVEDQRHLRQDILDELSAAGYEAVGATDGREALDALRTIRPHLILCDISMPRLDGYGLLEAVRSRHADLADVPFVFLTALNQRDEIIQGKRAGADDYLVKPIDYDLLLATIEARLRQVSLIDDRQKNELETLRQALVGDGTDRSLGMNGMESVLNVLSFGIVLVSFSGVVFANRAAQEIHMAKDGLVIDRTLHTGSSQLANDIRQLLANACAAACKGQDHLASLTVPRPSGLRDFLLTVCSLPDSTGRPNDGAKAVVFVSDLEHRPRMRDEILAGLFDLTPTEAEVARALVQGRRTDEIAQELSIAQTTVAFHLRNLFDKTGTHRQADLIALLLTGLVSIKEPRQNGVKCGEAESGPAVTSPGQP
ncbi:response regulator [Roseibium sp. LAB1]